MYSKLPMPHTEWNEEDMRYVMCFFPWIGIVIGAVVYGAFLIGKWAESVRNLPGWVFALIASVIPVLITGGIHLDGYIDTSDALASYGTREKKLEILKDSHIGAFAAIRLSVLMLLTVVGFGCLRGNTQDFLLLGAGYFLSRICSAIALLTVKGAKKEGTLYTFAHAAHRYIVLSVLFLYLAAGIIFCIFMGRNGRLPGGCGLYTLLGGALAVVYYIRMAKKQFGGLTGDLAGWFVTVFELVWLWGICIWS